MAATPTPNAQETKSQGAKRKFRVLVRIGEDLCGAGAYVLDKDKFDSPSDLSIVTRWLMMGGAVEANQQDLDGGESDSDDDRDKDDVSDKSDGERPAKRVKTEAPAPDAAVTFDQWAWTRIASRESAKADALVEHYTKNGAILTPANASRFVIDGQTEILLGTEVE